MAPSTQGIPLGQERAYQIALGQLEAMRGERAPTAVWAKIKRRPHPASNGRCYTGLSLKLDHAFHIEHLAKDAAAVVVARMKSILAWANGFEKCVEARAVLAKKEPTAKKLGFAKLTIPLLTALLRWECGVEKPASIKELLLAQIAPFRQKLAEPPAYADWQPAEAIKK